MKTPKGAGLLLRPLSGARPLPQAGDGTANMKWWPPLSPFMGGNLNHAHYPDGDGTDFLDVDLSGADGCLQFTIDGA
jgi:hypothetical protein